MCFVNVFWLNNYMKIRSYDDKQDKVPTSVCKEVGFRYGPVVIFYSTRQAHKGKTLVKYGPKIFIHN